MRVYCVLILREQQSAFCKESFVFTCLAYRNVQRFRNGVEFYGLKASQISKVWARSHKYPHVEKIKNLREKNFKGEASNTQLDSDDTQQSNFSSQYLSLTLA